MSKTALASAAAIIAGTGLAHAAGIERNAPSTRVLFEEGRYLEFSFSHVAPDLSGSGGLLAPGASTGDLFESYETLSFAYKADLNDRWSYALILDQPHGVDTLYPIAAGSGYSGTSATLDAQQLTGILAYRFNENVTAYGGLRVEKVEAEAFFPFGGALGLAGPYSVSADADIGVGWMAGVAYERKDIALRVALTYYSEIEHTHDTTENNGGTVSFTQTAITTPESLNLEFQTGIMADTLLFGGIRWVNWSEFAIAPPVFTANVGQPLVNYREDWTTYTLGLGRRFNENWSGAIQVSHEPAAGYTPLTTLGPVDGRTSIGLAATYTMDNVKITGGITYVDLGGTSNFAGTQFDGGDAIGVGFRVGYSF